MLRHPAIVIEGAFEDSLLNDTKIEANSLAERGKPVFSRCNRNTVDEDGGFRAICRQTLQVLFSALDTFIYNVISQYVFKCERYMFFMERGVFDRCVEDGLVRMSKLLAICRLRNMSVFFPDVKHRYLLLANNLAQQLVHTLLADNRPPWPAR